MQGSLLSGSKVIHNEQESSIERHTLEDTETNPKNNRGRRVLAISGTELS